MILIISAPEDVHAQAVMRELAARKIEGARILNLSHFPLQMTVAMRLAVEGTNQFELRLGGDPPFDMRDVRAVWWRRPQPFGIPSSVTDPAVRHFLVSEAATAFQGMWQASPALWINDIFHDAAAAHKPWQLALAKEVGLSIPRTLITNNPAEAKEFWEKFPDKTVYKPFTASYQTWRETRVLRDDEKVLANSVQLAPVIFQEYVDAQFDLRVTVIGQRIFAAEAHSQEGQYKVDVRFNKDISYKEHLLPETIQSKLLQLMRRLGLEYGAIDMRLTPDGDYVFLEINPAGQYLYVEQATGQRISEALAEHLAEGVPSS